jgi:hypothetical protein
MRQEGTQITWTWFADIHCRDEYRLKIGREALRRHAVSHLGLDV